MIVGDLLIKLGVTGDKEAKKNLEGVGKTLGDIKTNSLAAKVAIVGAMYALKEMMTAAGTRGMELQKFANATGLSTTNLQKWQYMARQSGVAAETMQASVESVQDTMDKMATGQGTPKGIAFIQTSLNNSGINFDIDRAKRDTQYMLEMAMIYSKTTKDTVARQNDWLTSLGLSKEVIAMMRTTTVEWKRISKQEIVSPQDIARLAEIKVAWANFDSMLEKEGNKLTLLFGNKGIQDITNLAKAFYELSASLIQFANAVHLFDLLKMSMQGWKEIADGVTSMVNGLAKSGTWKSEKYSELSGTWGYLREKNHDLLVGIKDFIQGTAMSIEEAVGGPGAVKYNKATGGSGGDTNINIENNFHGDVKPKETHDAVKKGVHGAWNQIQSKFQVV